MYCTLRLYIDYGILTLLLCRCSDAPYIDRIWKNLDVTDQLGFPIQWGLAQVGKELPANCDVIKQNESEFEKYENLVFIFIVCLNFIAISC